MLDASGPQRRCIACALRSRNKKQLAIFSNLRLKINKSALHRIQINDVGLSFGDTITKQIISTFFLAEVMQNDIPNTYI